MATVKERLTTSSDGTLTIKVTPEEYMVLAERAGEELYCMYNEGQAPGFSFEGIYVFTEDVEELRELQKARATIDLDSALWKPGR